MEAVVARTMQEKAMLIQSMERGKKTDMMERPAAKTLQQRARQIGKAAIALAVIVAAQVVALEVVVRGWQCKEAVVVFGGIAASAILCALAVIIFLYTRQRRSP